MREKRLAKMNELLRFIGDHGRRFFYYKGNYSHFQLRSNGLWLIQHYGDPVYVHRGNYSKFTNGGTLKLFIESLVRYYFEGKKIYLKWPQWCSEGDPWDYGEDMDKVRTKAIELGIHQ
jgi:hypothetical protein